MRRRLRLWAAGGILWTVTIGTLLHFTYRWSGGAMLAAAFSAVNESTWEHMKLLFVPVFLFTVVQVGFLARDYPNFLAVRTISALTGTGLIPVLFYTYTGIVGTYVLWADIAVFVLSVLGTFLLELYLLRRSRSTAPWQQLAGLLALWGLAFAFVWCTFHPPHLALWQDPVTGLYGIP